MLPVAHLPAVPSIGERIRAAREGRSLTRETLAGAIGKSVRSLQDYETDETIPPSDVLKRIAQTTGKDPAWLLDMNAQVSAETPFLSASDDTAPEGYRRIPVIRVEADAGEGYLPEVYVEEEDGNVLLPEWYIRVEYGVSPERVRMIRVRGSSMEPTLCPGQRLLVAMLPDAAVIHDGLVYVISGPSGIQVKRLFIVQDEDGRTFIHIWSDNPEGQRYRVPAKVFEEGYRLVAVALEINHKL